MEPSGGVGRAEVQLYCEGTLEGELTDYGYETPWATARLIPLRDDSLGRLTAASKVIADLERLPERKTTEESDVDYARLLHDHGVPEQDVRRFVSGRWAVRQADRSERPIALQDVDERGWVTWRWL
jgi:hypothetical protein